MIPSMLRLLLICMLIADWRAHAQVTCKQQNTEIVCTAGTSDHTLQRGLVSDNNRVTIIILKGCKIAKVELESFEELPALEYLDLSLNKIKDLELGVLDEFKNLKSLNLSYNQLTTFPLGLFDQKPNLINLDLRGNQINELELGILDPMTKLKYLDLSDNALLGRSMNPYIFDQSPLIQELSFSGNDMSDSHDILLRNLNHLQILNLGNCFLTEIPKFAVAQNLKEMTHLMLFKNKITSLDDATIFAHLENLKILNLSENAIDNVVESIFIPLKKLSSVVLRGNRLTQIPEKIFQNMPKLLVVDLANNLIEFVPVNAFRGSKIKYLNLANNRFTYLTDNFCLELKNSGGMLKKFYFNQNPWQCACLRDIITEVKSFDIEYNSVKFNGSEPVCVTGDRFNCERQPDANSKYIDMYYELFSGNN